MSHSELLDAELRSFHIDLPPRQKATLARYCDVLTKWNEKINLTGLTGAEMVRRLVVEPVWIGLQLELTGVLADIGSGNGSPGIPLHVVATLSRTHLIEVRSKRAAFLRHVTGILHLERMEVEQARFEDILDALETPQWITLQGVSLSPRLLETIRRGTGPETTVIWITSALKPQSPSPTRALEIPVTGSKVCLYRMDLS